MTPKSTSTPVPTTTPGTTTTLASAYGTSTPSSQNTPSSSTYVLANLSEQGMPSTSCTGKTDVNNYIQLAIHATNSGNLPSVLNNIDNAISAQAKIGNDAVVQLLEAAKIFFTSYQNTGTLSSWNQGKSMLLAAQQILSILASGFSYDYGGNLQGAVVALNPIQKDITTAMNYLNNSISVQTTNRNTDAAGFLRQAITFLRITNPDVLNNSLTPMQVALYEIASALANLNVKYAANNGGQANNCANPSVAQPVVPSTVQTVAPIVPTSPSTTQTIATIVPKNTSKHSWWRSQFQLNMNVPKVIQNFLDARSMYNDSVNNLSTFITEKGNYDKVIQELQKVQTDLNNL